MDYARYHWFWRRKKLDGGGAISAALSGSSSISAFAYDAARGFDIASTINGSSSISADWRYTLNATVTINGSSSISQAELVDGSWSNTQSLYHDGSGNANLGAMTSLNGATQAWVSVWVRFDGVPAGNEYIVSSIQASNRQFALYATGSTLRAYVSSTTASLSDYLQWNSALPSNTWFHLLMQYDGTQGVNNNRVDVYLNGSDLGAPSTSAGSIPTAMTSPASPVFYLGVPDAQGVNPAWLDNLSVGTGLLTSGDRAALYNSGSPPHVGNLSLSGGTALHWWPVGELGDDASNLYDQIGSRDGTITGLALQAEVP